MCTSRLVQSHWGTGVPTYSLDHLSITTSAHQQPHSPGLQPGETTLSSSEKPGAPPFFPGV